MNLIATIKRFIRCESGAVTVDWVVLTAAVVALGVTLGSEMQSVATGMVSAITASITAAPFNQP